MGDLGPVKLFCFVLFERHVEVKFFTELLLKSVFKKPVLKYCEVVTLRRFKPHSVLVKNVPPLSLE